MDWFSPYMLSTVPMVVFLAIWAQYRYARAAAPRSFARILRALVVGAAISLIFPVVVALLGGNTWRLWADLLAGYSLVALVAYAAMGPLGVRPDPHTPPHVRVTRR